MSIMILLLLSFLPVFASELDHCSKLIQKVSILSGLADKKGYHPKLNVTIAESKAGEDKYHDVSSNIKTGTPGVLELKEQSKKTGHFFRTAFLPAGSKPSLTEDSFVGVFIVVNEKGNNTDTFTFRARSPSCNMYECRGLYCVALKKEGFFENSPAKTKVQKKGSSNQQ